VIGTGYVGLTTGLALAYLGHKVSCVDKDPEIVEKLKKG
jgi:UDPglucose 6-dehydrogenase